MRDITRVPLGARRSKPKKNPKARRTCGECNKKAPTHLGFFKADFLLNFRALLSKWSSKTHQKITKNPCRKKITKNMRKFPCAFFFF
jgi:hypothetical protein